jgi:formate-dependent phosphoribosylglycinamide formyltransferase (GAR transformylase)
MLKVGDTIETTLHGWCESHPKRRLTVILCNDESVRHAEQLIARGTWGKVEDNTAGDVK